ncbi:MAG TPA: 50S ribosomal protein L23 [Sedimentisphaerales bacterium]|nr:50S ribosomal protein L23 [Sedimentisphaerales bacterium]
MLNDYNIIIRPLITEQGIHFANTRGAYSFEVDKRANKAQIKSAVEKVYGVKVEKIRTANRKGKYRRRGRTSGMTASWKKAVVVLKPDYHIDLF